MKRPYMLIFLLCALTIGSFSTVHAQEPQLSDQELRTLRRLLQKQEAAQPTPPPPSQQQDTSLQSLATPRAPGKKYSSSMEGSGKLIFARPFVNAPKAILGGYMDIEYFNRTNRGNPSFFDQHRLVPFIYGDISEHVKFAAEIEFEHGNQLGVEFAAIDYLVKEPFNLRAGLLLLPLGKFNLLHDSPLRDLTERPLVAQRIIPTTLRQPGIGAYGTLYPSSLSQLNYEFYVTSGFTGAFGGNNNPNTTSNITPLNGLRSARSSSTSFDNNNGKAFVGRVAFSPLLGIEVGGSGFFGSYDPSSNRPIAIWAVDWTLQRGPFELIGESAWAYIRDNHLNSNGTPNPGNPRRMMGYYIQANYHFLPAWLTRVAPNYFRPEISTFTAVIRWEDINLAQDLDNLNFGATAQELALRGSRQRLTLGLNYRPTEDTVFKLDFQYSPEEVSDGNTFTGAAQPTITPGSGGRERIHDTAFVASWATYF